MLLKVINACSDSKRLPAPGRDYTGMPGMKPMGDQVILQSGIVTTAGCRHYAMNLPTRIVITGRCSMQVLEKASSAAHTYRQRCGERNIRSFRTALRWDAPESGIARVK